MRSSLLKLLAALLAVSLVLASCGNRDDDSDSSDNDDDTEESGEGASDLLDLDDCPPDNGTDGIGDDNVITLASSFPQSGLTAAFAQIAVGYKAYFDKVNADGGVEIAGETYTIEVVDKDDEYNAGTTIQNINELAGTDGSNAFAVFNVVGTANNIAIRDQLDENCVPNVFAATGSPAWGDDDYPWLIGSTLAPYTIEAAALGGYVVENMPDAKVAMLIQDDDFGEAYRLGFEQAFEGSDVEIVGTQTYTAGANEVSAQVTSLAATGADVFFNGATLLACPDAFTQAAANNWDPVTMVSGTCISKTLMGLAGENADGALAVSNILDTRDPAEMETEAAQEFLATLEAHAPADTDPENGVVAYGYTQGVIFVEILKTLESLDRASLMEAMYNIDLPAVGMLYEGATVKTSEDDKFLVENVQLLEYNAADGYFNKIGELLDFEGQTEDLTPENLIDG